MEENPKITERKGIQDKLTLSATYLRFFFEQELLAHASGFLWKSGNQTFLISNWHNFTGRDPTTKQPARKDGGTPDTVEVFLYKDKLANGQVIAAGGMTWEGYRYALVSEGQPLFLEHPFGSLIDVAALEIRLHEHVKPFYLNEHKFEDELTFTAGQDVFIVGYPLGIITGRPIAIWKRGSIASEPYLPIDGLLKVLVDTASRTGMSGSFVVAQHTGIFNPSGHWRDDSWIGTGRKILGVYSGRIGPSDFEAQVGIVWRHELIDEILTKGNVARI
jgi:hypothetical protein